MATYSTNEFKVGLKVLLDGNPCNILANEFVKPGKGQAFNRVKLRDLKTGHVLEKTFKSGETLPGADASDIEAQYLYNDDTHWYFMNPDNYEQYSVAGDLLADTKQWLKEQDVCILTLWNETILSVMPPVTVTLKIVETDPGLKGDTAAGGTKPAVLETGATVRVPLFVQTGELVKVNTRTGEYVSRGKETA